MNHTSEAFAWLHGPDTPQKLETTCGQRQGCFFMAYSTNLHLSRKSSYTNNHCYITNIFYIYESYYLPIISIITKDPLLINSRHLPLSSNNLLHMLNLSQLTSCMLIPQLTYSSTCPRSPQLVARTHALILNAFSNIPTYITTTNTQINLA